ncbi:uncharacterized protein LOC134330712 isoform X2 [Trichomycterus rosablanca]|uniref:uncharacterized protein LOC134330712 isoform X2 n=1 Tax=Trichomycterus rosablanca TaxID=2290929 RepID=UPI002F35235B
MWIQMIRRLFGKRTKVRPFTEKEEEKEANDLKLEEFVDGKEEQKNLVKKQEHLHASTPQKKPVESQEVLLSVHRILKQHAECSGHLLKRMVSLLDIFEKIASAENESVVHPVSQAGTPIEILQDSCVDSIMISGTEINKVELKTVDELSTKEETKSLTIDNLQNEPLDDQIRRLEMECHAEIAKLSKFEKEEKLKLKLEMAEAKQKRQNQIEELKLKMKLLEKEAKREKQEGKKKLKDLEKEIKNKKSVLLIKLKELKNNLRMKKKEEGKKGKMENNKKDDEKVDETKDKNVIKSKFRKELRVRSTKVRQHHIMSCHCRIKHFGRL